MNKNSKIILNILIIILLGLIIFLVIRNYMTEGKLKKEINTIYDLINNEPYDYEKIYNKINTIVTKNGYALVEDAAKEYLFDWFDKKLKLKDIINNEKERNILTIENYLEDGPKFVETKKFLKEQKQKVLNLTAEMLADLETKTIMSYIIDKNLEDSYNNLYQNLIFAKEENLKKNKETIEKTVELYIKNNDNKQKVINFLENNNWTVKDNAIIFDEPELSNEYNELIMNLQ